MWADIESFLTESYKMMLPTTKFVLKKLLVMESSSLLSLLVIFFYSFISQNTTPFILRMWDIDNEENYILTLDGHSGYDQHETITCIHYSEKKGW